MEWQASFGSSLVIDMLETDIGYGTITAVPSTDEEVITDLRLIGEIPDWLQVSSIAPTLSLTAKLNDSPFHYAVHSVNPIISVNDFDQLLCGQNVWLYERLDSGIKDVMIAAQATVKTNSQIAGAVTNKVTSDFVIRVRANYSIGRDRLKEIVKCQP